MPAVSRSYEHLTTRLIRKFRSALTCLLGLFLVTPSVPAVELSQQEQAWLDQHRVLVFGGARDLPPFNYLDSEGLYKGYNADLTRTIAEMLDVEIRIRSGDWSDMQEQVRRKDLDGLLGPSLTAERQEYLLFTEPYLEMPNAIFTLEDHPTIDGPADLAGLSVAIHEGSSSIELFRDQYPEIRISPSSDHVEALLAVSTRQVDAAFMGISAGLYEIHRNVITNLRAAALVETGDTDMRFAVRKDWPILASILQKALDEISEQQWQALNQKWIGTAAGPGGDRVGLTENERQWLQAHPVVRVVVDQDSAPIEFRDPDGNYKGISLEYLDRIEELLGIRLEIAEDMTWAEGMEAVAERRLDMISSVAETAQRRQSLSFTEPFNFMPIKIFARNDISFVGSLDNLAGKKVAVNAGTPLVVWLARDYPELDLIVVQPPTEGLLQLSDGKIDAFVDNMVTTSYYIGKLRLSNVRIAGETPYSHNQAMAVRNDWPEFATILQKAISAIEPEERQAFFNRWMSIRYEVEADYRLAWSAAAASVVIIALFVYWNRRLAREVVARQQTEVSLQMAKAAADEANQAKSDFLANMSHEIRTPMNAITGLSRLCLETDLTTRQRDYVSKIHGAAGSLLRIVNDVLDLSKIEARKLELEKIEFDLQEVVDNLATVIGLKAEEQGLELVLGMLPGTPRFLVGDPVRLTQVLTNLATNAVKFTEHGEVKVLVEALQLESEKDQPQKTLKFTVSDTGIGMEPSRLDAVFQSFSQADISTARLYGGSGLGLTICRDLVEMMGGSIRVRSRPGAGSTFTIELPFTIARASRRRGQLPPESVPPRMLVVDDNPAWRRLITAHLGSFNGLTEAVDSGRAALDRIQADPPLDLVVLDMKMPDMDGLETARKIAALGLAEPPPVLLMVTAFDHFENQLNDDDEAVSDIIVKPISQLRLFDAVSALLSGHRKARSGPHKLASIKSGTRTDFAGLRVLVAEDNPLNQQVIQELLELYGFEVDLAADGREALAQIDKATYAAVLMDIQMPNMDGHEATRRIRQRPEYADLPIIALTGGLVSMDDQDRLQEGMNAVISKPINLKQLEATLRRWILREQA